MFVMNKLGDIRADGMVFVHKNSNGYEYWATMEAFLRLHGNDWFERRKRMNENVRLRAIEKADAQRRREQRALFIEAHPLKPKRVRREFSSEEERIAAKREWELAYRKTPKQLEWKKQYNAKLREFSEIRKAQREAERELKKAAKLAETEARKEARRIAAEERRIKEALRPKRVKVILTDEQRLEAKRRDRKNQKHRRRAILRGQEAKATSKQIEAQRVKAKGRCYYCRQKSNHLTIDHIVPIAKGGGHTLDNIVFACHACNSEKRDLAPEEYGKKHGLLLV